MFDAVVDGNISIHCRTGSLEKSRRRQAMRQLIHCRTGSLEIGDPLRVRVKAIHCRTGSLEN